MTPHVAAIVNPRSDNGRTGRAWRLMADALIRELGPIKTHFTASPATQAYLPAAELTRVALQQGAQLVIAVGGDATVNEVVNGFFDQDAPINPEAHLAILPAGATNRTAKSLNIPEEFEKSIPLIGRGTSRAIHVGLADFETEDGSRKRRCFIHEASFGAAGLAAFWTSSSMRVAADSGHDETIRGRVTLRIADDGMFELSHKGMPLRTATASVTPLQKKSVSLDLDHERSGQLPARFQILRHAITLRC